MSLHGFMRNYCASNDLRAGTCHMAGSETAHVGGNKTTPARATGPDSTGGSQPLSR